MSKTLFKFCTAPGAIAVLERNAIFITSPLDLNDPFEMRPAWTNAHEARHQENERRRDEMMVNAPVFVALKGGKLARAGKMPSIPLSSVGPMDVESQRGIADTHNEIAFMVFHQSFRVLCFVGSLFDLSAKGGQSNEQATLLWSHYGDQFQGICLAVDPAGFDNGIQAGGFAVQYDRERRSLPVSFYDSFLAVDSECSGVPGRERDAESGLLLTPEEKTALTRRRFIDLLTHKSPAWAYEQEVRMIYEIGQQRQSPDYRPIRFPCETCKQKGVPVQKCEKPYYRDAIRLPPEAVSAVIFGADSMLSTVQNVFSILDTPRYKHVEVYWSCLHSSRYAVQYVKGDRSYIETLHEHQTEQIAMAKGHVWRDRDGLKMRPSPKGVNYEPPKRPALPSIECPRCHTAVAARASVGRPARASDYNSCLRQCEPCGLGFSNARTVKDVVIIYREPFAGIPEDICAGLGDALESSLNVDSRSKKRERLASSNSEDHLTWVVFRQPTGQPGHLHRSVLPSGFVGRDWETGGQPDFRPFELRKEPPFGQMLSLIR